MLNRATLYLPPTKATSVAAMGWGAALLLPVGVHYFTFFSFVLAALLSGDFAARKDRILSSGLFWPAALFTTWTVAVFALQSEIFPQTASHLFHGFRIALTLLVAASMSWEEARAAIKGMIACLAAVLLWQLGYCTGAFPVMDFWTHITHPTTNKSISAAIVFSLAATAALAATLSRGGWPRLWGVVVCVVCVLMIVSVLGKRTAMIGVLLGAIAIMCHLWRGHPLRLLAGVAVVFSLSAALYATVPQLQKRMVQGIGEINSALAGHVTPESWNLRIQMTRHTTEMMLERPLLGWGIGSWNTQWKLRVSEQIANVNMPHNDLLWMGAQAGIPGALAWLSLLLAGCWVGWRTQTPAGQIAFAVGIITLFSSLVNNGTRDATLAFPMLMVLGVSLAMARQDRLTSLR